MANNGSDNEVVKSEGEEDTPKAHKSTSKKSVKEGSVAKAEAKSTSVKKTSAKAAKSSEKTPKKSIPKKSITEQDSASLSKSDQPATKIQKTGKEKQDTKGKAASKTAKAPVKDQGALITFSLFMFDDDVLYRLQCLIKGYLLVYWLVHSF